MQSNELVDKLTPLLYLGKVTCAQTCWMQYYFNHHLHLQPISKPANLTFGSFCHKIFLEVGLLHSFQAAEAILQDRPDLAEAFNFQPDDKVVEMVQSTSKADKDLALNMLDAFQPVWEAKPRKLLSVEQTVKFPISHLSDFFTHWCVKADMVFEDDEGRWIGDLKTTSAYGPSVAKYYHTAPQTKAYFWILQQLMPDLRGTKIFVVTKKAVRCEVETVLLTDQDKHQAELFVTEAVKEITEHEARSRGLIEHIDGSTEEASDPTRFPRRMTRCLDYFGKECPYIPICIEKIKSQEYLNEVLSNWYKIESPDEHLELES